MTTNAQFEYAAELISENIASYKRKPKLRAGLAWQIAQTIFNIKNPSGKISVRAAAALAAGDIKHSALTREHMFPRMKTAYFILDYFSSREVDFDELIAIIANRSLTNIVTKSENQALKTLNADKKDPLRDAYWQEQYAHPRVDIVLIDDTHVPKRGRGAKKYVYIIHSSEYDSIEEVAHVYNCSTQTVYNRCASYSEKFIDWIREEAA
jgi:hypothetical protein